jgi:hypothetical protein
MHSELLPKQIAKTPDLLKTAAILDLAAILNFAITSILTQRTL